MNYETTVDLSDADNSEIDLHGVARGSRRQRRLWIAAAIVLVALLTGYLVYSRSTGSDSASNEDQAPTVSVVAPGSGTIEGTINATGTLAARREMPVGVVGEGGRVVSVQVEAGQWVRAGQVLAVIDRSVQTQQVQSSAAQIEVSRADARLAQANLDRALQLVDRGFISKADVDRLTATRDAAAARVRVAEAQHRELLARNARLNIVAPHAGLILERNVEPGQVVGAGAGTLFSIAKDGEMELLAEVGEVDLAKLSPGVNATVTPVGADRHFVGQVWQLSPVINEQDRQGIARIALAYAPELRPGGFASAEINSGTVVAPMLPESAFQNDDKGTFVYIVGADNKVVRRDVKTGMVTARGIAVVQGLSGSERVVVRAGGFLSPGEEVRPQPAKRGN